jgi:hypothetical protein
LHTLAMKVGHAIGSPTHHSADIWSCSAPLPRNSTGSLQSKAGKGQTEICDVAGHQGFRKKKVRINCIPLLDF